VNESQILGVISELAHTQLGWSGPLEPEMDLVEDLQLDSLKLLTLAVNVENHFQICLDPDDEAGIRSVGDLVSVIEHKLTRGTECTP